MEGSIMADLRVSGLGGVPKGTTEDRPSSPSIGDVFYNGTRGLLEIYTSQGWVVSSATPPVPTDVSATNQPSSRAYNNGQMSVSFSNGSGGGFISTYIVTPSPATSPATFSGSSSPIVVTGLQSSTQYTYTIQANNDFGTSLSSSTSAAVTATTVPQAPTIGTATRTTGVVYGGSPSASLTFTAGATGGSSITNYKYSTDGTNYTAFSPAQTTSPLTFSGLTAGTSYAFRLKAVNANGDSAASSAASSITAATVPQAPTITSSAGYGTSGQVVVEISPNNNGGSEITSYTVTASPGGATATGSSTTIAVNGLTDNTSYSFTAVATNAIGNSASSSSSSGTPIYLNPILATAEGGYGNSGNTGGNGGSGGGSGADSGNNGGGVGGYDGSNGAGGRAGTGQLNVAYGSGTNPYIPVGGTGLQNGQPSATYAGLGPNSAGSGPGTYMNQDNTSTRVSGVGRGSGGSEGGWVAQGGAGQDGLVAWTNTAGGSGTINDTESSWAPPTSSTYTFYIIGGGGGGAGGYRGPGGSGYYATGSRFLTTSNRLTVTIGTGGARGGRFGTGGRGGTTSVVVAS
jgi:trimeric autotransporter adhesin